MSEQLVATARRLAGASRKKPRQSDLKRAVSTAYYALFHSMARNAADMLVGVGSDRPDKAWTQVYRSLEHGPAKNACKELRNLGFPAALIGCGDAFVQLQQARHDADYDPDHSVNLATALAMTELAENAVRDLKASPRKDRKAFAVQVLLKRR